MTNPPGAMPPLPPLSYLGEGGESNYGYDREDMREYAKAYAAPLIARVAELQRQNEAQKDEWLSWDAKRVALELFASRWQQLEHMYSKGATANTLGHYIGRPERLDYAAKLRAEHDAAIAAKD